MATSKIFNIGESPDSPHKYLKNSLAYISKPEKTDNGKWIGTINCNRGEEYKTMLETKQIFGKTDKRQAYHLWISFPGKEVPPEIAFEIIGKFANRFLGMEYEAMYSVHTDRPNIHGHIVFNSVSFIDGLKYHYANGDWAKIIQPIVNDLCGEYGLSQLEINERGFCKEHKYSGNRATFNKMIRKDIDCLIMTCQRYDEFVEGLRVRGYQVENAYGEGAYMKIKPPGMERFRRIKSLGTEYSEERIRERLQSKEIVLDEKKEEMRPKLGKTVRISKYYGSRMKLTKMQKKAFARKYRLQKMRKQRYSDVWKYRQQIQDFKKAQEQYLYLVKNHVSTESDVEAQLKRDRAEYRLISLEKRKLFQERHSFTELFELLDKLERLQEAEEMWQAGMGFEEAHSQYWKVLSKIHAAGVEPDSLKDIHQHYKEKLSTVCSEERRLNKKIKIEKEILKDFEEEQRRTMYQEQKKEGKIR